MSKEKSILELYKEQFVEKQETKRLDIGQIKDMKRKITNEESFPIIIDSNDKKTAKAFHSIVSLKEIMVEFVAAWERVFKKKPLIKNVTQAGDGRLFEVELKLIYIEVFSIEKKYPEFSISKLMEVIEYPNFSEILEVSEQVNRKWYLISDYVKGILTIEDLYSNGNPDIDAKWIEKIASRNHVCIKNEDQRKELLIILSFLESFLEMLSFCRVQDGQYEKIIKVLSNKGEFIHLWNFDVNIAPLQNALGLTSFNIS
nr:hypothetical protein [Cytophagales bacterium]